MIKATLDHITIDGLSLKVHDNLGIKSLIVPDDMKALGTLIGELGKEHGIHLSEQLMKGELVENQAFVLSEVTPSQQEEARTYWHKKSNHPIESEMIQLLIPQMGWQSFLPKTTLLKVIDKVKSLQAESHLIAPPWLFREEPLAGFACRKPPYELDEMRLMQQLEEELMNFKITDTGYLLDKDGNSLEDQHPLMQKLKRRGMLSPEESTMKLDELNTWGFAKLASFYKSKKKQLN
jgi:hypothetical protein